MKQYVIDELRPQEYEKIKAYMDETFDSSAPGGVYWIALAPEILNDVQISHTGCQPFYFAIDLEPTLMACEFLVRTRNKMRCSCINYATERQRNWIIEVVDAIFEKLGIKT